MAGGGSRWVRWSSLFGTASLISRGVPCPKKLGRSECFPSVLSLRSRRGRAGFVRRYRALFRARRARGKLPHQRTAGRRRCGSADELVAIVSRRHELGALLNDALRNAPGILPPLVTPQGYRSYWFYLFRLDLKRLTCTRGDFFRACKEEGVWSVLYPDARLSVQSVPEPQFLWGNLASARFWSHANGLSAGLASYSGKHPARLHPSTGQRGDDRFIHVQGRQSHSDGCRAIRPLTSEPDANRPGAVKIGVLTDMEGLSGIDAWEAVLRFRRSGPGIPLWPGSAGGGDQCGRSRLLQLGPPKSSYGTATVVIASVESKAADWIRARDWHASSPPIHCGSKDWTGASPVS